MESKDSVENRGIILRTLKRHPGYSLPAVRCEVTGLLSAAKHVRRILESALLCGLYEFLHRSKFALGQLGECGLNETIFGMLRFEFKL